MNVRFKKAFDIFIKEIIRDASVTGILFFGSVQRNEATDSSDLDFYIIVDGEEGWNYKRNIKGIPVEAYFFPEHFWRRLIKENVQVMIAFATGSVIHDSKSLTKSLVDMANDIYHKGPKALSSIKKANWRITLTELISDIEGLEGNGFVFLGWAITKALEGYCELNQLWPIKPDNLVPYVLSKDNELGELIDQFCSNPSKSTATGIIHYILTKHDGPIKEYEGPRMNLNE